MSCVMLGFEQVGRLIFTYGRLYSQTQPSAAAKLC